MTSRSTWILLLPCGALALVLALAWRAVETTVGHRRAAEAVLGDHAEPAAQEIAAQEIVRRGTNEVGYDGFFPRIRLQSEGFVDPTLPLSTATPGVDPEDQTVKTELIQRVFRRTGAGLELSPSDGELAAWPDRRLAAEPESDAPVRVLHGMAAGGGARDQVQIRSGCRPRSIGPPRSMGHLGQPPPRPVASLRLLAPSMWRHGDPCRGSMGAGEP